MRHPKSTLVLGGARSGKSRYAQVLAETIAPRRTFIATAEAFDAEMADRIGRHRADRDRSWQTVEAPLKLAEAIQDASPSSGVLLVDCLTLWASNLLLAGEDMVSAGTALASAVEHCRCPIVLVSNEVGFGIVPENALSRQFRDVAGRLNQEIALVCEAAFLVVAGLPLELKSPK